jgi:hypothetical protein
MKVTGLALVLLLAAPSFAFGGTGISIGGQEIIRIDADNQAVIVDTGRPRSTNELQMENARLRERVLRLEMAVRQLQERTFSLEVTGSRPAPAPAKEFACYIKTTFNGTVMAKGSSEAEARAGALKACDDKDGGFSCEESKIKCSST